MAAPSLTLYMSESCGYCKHVLTALKPLDLEVEVCSIHREPGAREELRAATGRSTVPVLRIGAEEPDADAVWMPESLDIIRELQRRAGVEPKVPAWVDRATQLARPLGLGLLVASIFTPAPASEVLMWTGATIVLLSLLRRLL